MKYTGPIPEHTAPRLTRQVGQETHSQSVGRSATLVTSAQIMEEKMDIPITVLFAAGAILIAIVVAYYLLIKRARKFTLTHTAQGQKPGWMKTAPPKETIAATQADREGIALYDYDKGEKVASPFAEQIEDIIRARLNAIPELASVKVDFGTLPDGGLDICINGKSYTDINQIPDKQIRQVILESIKSWEQGQ